MKITKKLAAKMSGSRGDELHNASCRIREQILTGDFYRAGDPRRSIDIKMVMDFISDCRHEAATQSSPCSLSASRQKGGKARAAALSPERRSEIARAAARARWQSDA